MVPLTPDRVRSVPPLTSQISDRRRSQPLPGHTPDHLSARQDPTPPIGQPIGSGILDAAAAIAAAAGGYDERDLALPLTSRVAVNGIGADAFDDSFFRITIPAVTRSLQLRSYGGVGDVTLYAALGRMPTTASYDRRSGNAGNTEAVTFTSPAAGTYYVRLSSPTAYRNLSMIAVAQ